MTARHDGWIGWLLVAVVVLGWDTYACVTGGETLSSAYADAFRCPRRRRKTRTTTFVIIFHLIGPRGLGRFDPLHRLADVVRHRYATVA